MAYKAAEPVQSSTFKVQSLTQKMVPNVPAVPIVSAPSGRRTRKKAIKIRELTAETLRAQSKESLVKNTPISENSASLR
jgi:hypothetical protein